MQNFRKASDLEVDDHIKLNLSSTDKVIADAISQHADEIKAETLATSLSQDSEYQHSVSKKISGSELNISLQKD